MKTKLKAINSKLNNAEKSISVLEKRTIEINQKSKDKFKK